MKAFLAILTTLLVFYPGVGFGDDQFFSVYQCNSAPQVRKEDFSVLISHGESAGSQVTLSGHSYGREVFRDAVLTHREDSENGRVYADTVTHGETLKIRLDFDRVTEEGEISAQLQSSRGTHDLKCSSVHSFLN